VNKGGVVDLEKYHPLPQKHQKSKANLDRERAKVMGALRARSQFQFAENARAASYIVGKLLYFRASQVYNIATSSIHADKKGVHV